MFRLTREVRLNVTSGPGEPSDAEPSNNHAGFPSLRGLGHYFALQITLEGKLDARSQYLLNIKEIDRIVRARAAPAVESAVRSGAFQGGGDLARDLFTVLSDAWPRVTLAELRLSLSPFLAWSVLASEFPMVRLSQKFEFSASHRLHNPNLEDDENARLFGKCNNPLGHGHNYELQVTLTGEPDENGLLLDIPRFERIVADAVIDRLDHKNLNLEVHEFRALIPTVENIAMSIYHLLKPRLADAGAHLASVTVWETPKTWCEYLG